MSFIINNLLFKTIFIFHLSNNSIINAVEPLANVMIAIVLIILILFSLFLTFAKNSEAIHKVLGLLLVSIFVVFLWIFQTEFLFIYLVYILAFIGAVLMLFLSVVLMLPISTIQKKSTKLNQNIIIFYFFNFYTFYDLIKIIFYFLLWVIFIFTILNFIFEIFRIVISKRELEYQELFRENKKFIIIFTIKNFHDIHTLFLCILNFIIKFILIFSLWFYNKTKNLIKLISINTIEFLLQLITFINLIFLLIPVFFFEKNYNLFFLNENLSTAGLGNIKQLLYENNPFFLIISTIVLLIALIGAAVMTRNKQ